MLHEAQNYRGAVGIISKQETCWTMDVPVYYSVEPTLFIGGFSMDSNPPKRAEQNRRPKKGHDAFVSTLLTRNWFKKSQSCTVECLSWRFPGFAVTSSHEDSSNKVGGQLMNHWELNSQNMFQFQWWWEMLGNYRRFKRYLFSASGIVVGQPIWHRCSWWLLMDQLLRVHGILKVMEGANPYQYKYVFGIPVVCFPRYWFRRIAFGMSIRGWIPQNTIDIYQPWKPGNTSTHCSGFASYGYPCMFARGALENLPL